MKLFSDTTINEAKADAKKLQFIPCKASKGDQNFVVAVGNIFKIKEVKYAQEVENQLKQMGLTIATGIATAQKVIKQAGTKLIYTIIKSNQVSIYTADILKPLNSGEKL